MRRVHECRDGIRGSVWSGDGLTRLAGRYPPLQNFLEPLVRYTFATRPFTCFLSTLEVHRAAAMVSSLSAMCARPTLYSEICYHYLYVTLAPCRYRLSPML